MTHEEAEDVKRHFNVVAEGLRSEIRLVAEGHAGLDRRIDELRQEAHEYRAEARGELQLVAGSLRSDMADLRTDLANLREEMAGFRREVHGEFRDVRALIRLSDIRLERLEGQHS